MGVGVSVGVLINVGVVVGVGECWCWCGCRFAVDLGVRVYAGVCMGVGVAVGVGVSRLCLAPFLCEVCSLDEGLSSGLIFESVHRTGSSPTHDIHNTRIYAGDRGPLTGQ